MPVTQSCHQRFLNQRDLDQFLRSFQADAAPHCPQFLSLAFAIDPVDPLVVFNQLTHSDQLNFYFEKRSPTKPVVSATQPIAIAAIDAVAHCQLHHNQRFAEAQHFIQSTLAQTCRAGDLNSDFAGPLFCCSFTFQPSPTGETAAAVPATTIFLPRWQIVRTPDQCTVVCNLALTQQTTVAATVAEIWQTLQQIQAMQGARLPSVPPAAALVRTEITRPDDFKQAVAAALNSIQAGQFDKIVLAHAIEVTAPQPFHHAHSLNQLRHLYPDCYVFSMGTGRSQAFLGASPERLVSVQQRALTTDALAGSTPRGQTRQADAQLASRLLSSPKDNHEHQVVVDFITQQLIGLGLSPEPLPLRLLQLPNIQHLLTPIHATVPPSVHVLDVVAALHPTPAVAGLPRDVACTEIRRYEPFERSRYAAPIGWVNHRGDGEFAVGIRSALIDQCQARLFAGAGIVAGSDPDRELAEVQLKLQALLSALV